MTPTLDRLGRTVRGTLNALDALRERGIGVRTLKDAIPIDTTTVDSPMSQLAVILLALFAVMELTYSRGRAAHARAVAEKSGRRAGRPTVVDPKVLAYAVHLRDVDGAPISEIVERTTLSRATLYRHLPPRPALALTASGKPPAARE